MTATRSLVSVVDDDESVRESLPDMLRQFGFAAEAFPSAEAFLASDVIGRTNCLILDVAMPGMSGPDLQRELTTRRQNIPIVFVTASGDKTDPNPRYSRMEPSSACSSHSAKRTFSTHSMPRRFGRGRSASRVPDLTSNCLRCRRRCFGARIAGTADPECGLASRDVHLGRRFPVAAARAVFPVACCSMSHSPGLTASSSSSSSAERTDMPIIFITGHGDVPMTCPGDESGSRRVPDKAVQRRRAARAPSAAPSSAAAPHSVSTREIRGLTEPLRSRSLRANAR